MSVAAQNPAVNAKPISAKPSRSERAAPPPLERPALPPAQPRFADWAMI